ncbi:hypothetical protein Daus18300_003205 [Diaporthe australafricana]|uniref:Ubiquitin-like domain-containing protein n=1 Tax=Diaporthe australafricana TaxID=127596 RepID=A0ABR3XHL8_9PEZI
MANVIILIHGDSRHLVPKPADYADLLDVTREKFHEFHAVDDNNIAFHFTPEWFDGEVEIDGGAFAEVQNRAILRVTITPSPGSDVAKVRDGDVSEHHTGSASIKHDGRSSADIDDLPVDSIKLSFIHVPTNRKVPYLVAPGNPMKKIMVTMSKDLQFDLYKSKFVFKAETIQFVDIPRVLGMENGDVVEVYNA